MQRTRCVAEALASLPETHAAKAAALGVSVSTLRAWKHRADLGDESLYRVGPPSDKVVSRVMELLDAAEQRIASIRRELVECSTAD